MIAIITYNAPHRKTQDLLAQLTFKGYHDLMVLAIPFVQRKNFQPLFKHRPGKAVDVSLDDLCIRLGISCVHTPVEELADQVAHFQPEHTLIAGAGILPEELAKNHRVINAHPGYLPYTKGLDAFKWAIFHGQPIGVTTHYISEKADEGLLIDRKEVPVFFEDTFHSVAYRQYEMEIEMLTEAIALAEGSLPEESLSDDRYVANRRMPHHLELKMMHQFKKMIDDAPSVKEV